MYSLSLLFCQSSLNTMSSTVYLSSFEVFMLLAFIPHPISSFLVICFVLPITRTPANFFDFPWRFELSGIDCSWKRTRSCEERKSKVSSCNRESVRIKDIENFKITNARRISWVLPLEVYSLNQSTQLSWYLCLYLVQQLICRRHCSHSYHQHYYFHFLIGYFGILPGPEVDYKNNLGYGFWAGKLLLKYG